MKKLEKLEANLSKMHNVIGDLESTIKDIKCDISLYRQELLSGINGGD